MYSHSDEMEKNRKDDKETEIKKVTNKWFIIGHGVALVLELFGIIYGFILSAASSHTTLGLFLTTVSAASLLFFHCCWNYKMDLHVIQPQSSELPTYYKHTQNVLDCMM
jgi:uncharacterized membrane-anchored protein